MFVKPAKKHNKAALHITTVPKSNGAPKRAVAALNDSPTAAPTWALCASSTWAQILHPSLSAASMAPQLWAVHSDSRASLESQEAMSDANGDADTGLPDNDIWFVLVDGNAATCCSTGDKAVTQDPSTEENEENKVATQDPYMTIPSMTIPRKKRKKKKRSLTKKKKKKRSLKKKMKRRRNGAL